MLAIGDIVRIFAPVAGYDKYHLCLKVSDDAGAATFIYLNSEGGFADLFGVDCARVPCLPASATGKTHFSFGMLPRFNDNQLRLYKATKMGEIDPALASDLLAFAQTLKTLSKPEKVLVVNALASMADL